MRTNLLLLFFSFLLFACSKEQPTFDDILAKGSPDFNAVLNNPAHEIQIIYGALQGDSIVHHSYGLDSTHFFYPASTVKMLAALAAVQRMEDLQLPLSSVLTIDSTELYPRTVAYDSLFDGPITVEQLIKRIFVYSDNEAYNLLFGWLGKDYINGLYDSLGIPVRIVHQLSETAFSFPPITNSYTRQARLMTDSDTIFFEELAQSSVSSLLPDEQLKGVGYLDSLGNRVDGPFDFSQKNYASLGSLLGALERAIHPSLFEPSQRFNFSEATYQSLKEIMSLRPSQLPAPVNELPDNYVKFLMYGKDDSLSIPSSITIRNKVGWAYGYLLDVAFIEDRNEGVSFYLAATIHINSNRIYNDGNYEYETVGLPFLDELGELVYAYEVGRK